MNIYHLNLHTPVRIHKSIQSSLRLTYEQRSNEGRNPQLYQFQKSMISLMTE